VHSGCGRNEVIGLTATGIPPHILIANEIVKLRGDLAELRMDVIDRIDNLPEQLKTTMLANFEVNGVVPITQDMVAQMIDGLRVTLLDAISSNNAALRQSIESAQAGVNGDIAGFNGGLISQGNADFMHMWGGRFHPVPSGFRFPT
jgi:hypothetical protein